MDCVVFTVGKKNPHISKPTQLRLELFKGPLYFQMLRSWALAQWLCQFMNGRGDGHHLVNPSYVPCLNSALPSPLSRISALQKRSWEPHFPQPLSQYDSGLEFVGERNWHEIWRQKKRSYFSPQPGHMGRLKLTETSWRTHENHRLHCCRWVRVGGGDFQRILMSFPVIFWEFSTLVLQAEVSRVCFLYLWWHCL